MTKRTALRPRVRAGAYPAIFVAGAILGTALDRIHVAAGTLSYPGARFGQPWWVPVEFGLAMLGIVVVLARWGDPAPTKRSARSAIRELTWFVAAYGASALLWRSPAVCLLALALSLVPRLKTLQATGERHTVPAIALVITGPLVESALVAAGLFSYHDRASPFMGFPLWLPVLYMHAVPFAVRGTEFVLWIAGVRYMPDRGHVTDTSDALQEERREEPRA